MAKWYNYAFPITNLLPKGSPADKAMPYYEQIPGQAGQYLDPHIQQGQQAGGQAMDQYSQMAQDPTSLIESIMGSYKPSTGYQLNEKRMLDSMAGSAGAGGYAGTGYDDQKRAELVQGLLDQDKYGYLSNALGVQSQGLGGLENFAQRGFGAGGEMADITTQGLASQAGAAYHGQAQKDKFKADMLKAVIQAMASTAGAGGGGGGGGGGGTGSFGGW